jgi:hypothetical protein
VVTRSGEGLRIDLLPESLYCPPRDGAPTPACHGDRELVEDVEKTCRSLGRGGAPIHLTRGCKAIVLTCAWETLDVAVSDRYHEERTRPERVLLCRTESWLPILLSRIPFSAVEGLRVRSFAPDSFPVDRFEVYRSYLPSSPARER